MRVVWEEGVWQDLDAVFAYGSLRFGETVATRLVNQVLAYENLLAAHPYMGRREPYLAHLSIPYYSVVVHRHYKLIYQIDEEQDVVRILALWDTRQDPARLTDQL